MGVRSFFILNRALLCKLSWRFAVERESLWKLVISRKFGVERGGWSTREVREVYEVGLWKEIRKEGSLMFKKIAFLLGDGRRVRFWKDNWCRNKTLCDFFPSLYALVDSKDAWVADCWDSLGEEGGWNPRFSKSFNDWEVEAVESFLLTLQGKQLVFDFKDRVV